MKSTAPSPTVAASRPTRRMTPAWLNGSTTKAWRSRSARSGTTRRGLSRFWSRGFPFIALIGVWIFLSRQMRGARGKGTPDEIDDLKRQIDELQKRLDKLRDRDKT